MKRLYPLAIAIFTSSVICAQAPYWATDVAPILYANCTKCHNPAGIAPFSLITYNDAVNNGTDIATEVQNRTMPPWPPDTSYTRFCDERILSSQDIQTITDWVNNGMPAGNLAQAPTPPTYTGGPEITNADAVVQMPAYTVNTATDLYRCFVMPSNVPTTEYITKIEVIPGNRSIVHHVLVYQDQASTCVTLDNNDPGVGYTSFGGVGSSSATLVLGWVPGQGAYELPANMGIKLLANTNIIMQVHYPGGTVNQVDSTQVRFVFASGSVREVYLNPVINHSTSLTNGPLFIPANTIQTFHGEEFASMNATVISVAPHMHLVGKSMINYAIDPNGDTIPLITIDDWDFHWQGFYNYRQPIHIPFGSTIHAYATYDNTVNNPQNPNAANPQNVSAGESTTDEMMIVYMAYLSYQPGDENIIVDSTILAGQEEQSFGNLVKTPQLYAPYPVPANNGTLNISYFLPEKADVVIELVDVNGKVVRTISSGTATAAGFGTDVISIEGLAAGTYVLRLISGDCVKTKMVVIN
jgi:hypothetical protein